MESNETLTAILMALLVAGCGVPIKFVMDQIIKWRAEDNKPISSKTKRRVTLLLGLIIPSIIYGVVVALGNEYGVAAHILYMVGGFTSATALHGEIELPTGAEERTAKTFGPPVTKLGPDVFIAEKPQDGEE